MKVFVLDEKPTDEKFEAKGKDSLAEEDVEEAADKLRLLAGDPEGGKWGTTYMAIQPRKAGQCTF